jgi:hypothetical protein
VQKSNATASARIFLFILVDLFRGTTKVINERRTGSVRWRTLTEVQAFCNNVVTGSLTSGGWGLTPSGYLKRLRLRDVVFIAFHDNGQV